MLSTFDEPHTDIRLPDIAWQLLDIVKASGDKATRNDIAEALGKKALNSGDLAYLEVLDLNGYISIEKEPVHTPMGYQWVYKAINPDSK